MALCFELEIFEKLSRPPKDRCTQFVLTRVRRPRTNGKSLRNLTLELVPQETTGTTRLRDFPSPRRPMDDGRRRVGPGSTIQRIRPGVPDAFWASDQAWILLCFTSTKTLGAKRGFYQTRARVCGTRSRITWGTPDCEWIIQPWEIGALVSISSKSNAGRSAGAIFAIRLRIGHHLLHRRKFARANFIFSQRDCFSRSGPHPTVP